MTPDERPARDLIEGHVFGPDVQRRKRCLDRARSLYPELQPFHVRRAVYLDPPAVDRPHARVVDAEAHDVLATERRQNRPGRRHHPRRVGHVRQSETGTAAMKRPTRGTMSLKAVTLTRAMSSVPARTAATVKDSEFFEPLPSEPIRRRSPVCWLSSSPIWRTACTVGESAGSTSDDEKSLPSQGANPRRHARKVDIARTRMAPSSFGSTAPHYSGFVLGAPRNDAQSLSTELPGQWWAR